MIEYMRRMAIAMNAGNDVDPVQMNLDILLDGESFFMGNLIKEIKKRHLDIKVIGFEPWAESLETESKRIAKFFDLRI